MKVAIITYVAQESSRKLAKALKAAGIIANVFDMNHTNEWEVRKYDYIFAYGCSAASDYRIKRLNSAKATKACIDKLQTFAALSKVGVPIPEYTSDRKKAAARKWATTVVRDSRTGRKAEGYTLVDYPDKLPEGELFTEYFFHKREYRIVVFNGEVVGRYYKRPEIHKDGYEWHQFSLQRAGGFEDMDRYCLKAAKALGIDYVGFDVVSVDKRNFKILEANSGPILTDEAEAAIIKYFKEKK